MYAINGVDKNGQKVRFTREMIKEKMRTILSEAATNMVGERTYEEIKAEEAKLPLSPRWTKLDERLSQYKCKIYSRVLDVSLQQRLGYLCQINLAEKNGELFTLKPDWKEKLQIFIIYNTSHYPDMMNYDIINKSFKLSENYHTLSRLFAYSKDISRLSSSVDKTKNILYDIYSFDINSISMMKLLVSTSWIWKKSCVFPAASS